MPVVIQEPTMDSAMGEGWAETEAISAILALMYFQATKPRTMVMNTILTTVVSCCLENRFLRPDRG